MARTDVPLNDLSADGSLDDPSGVAGDAANGHVVDLSGWPRKRLEETFLRVVNGTTAVAVTVKAGDDPPALEAGAGDATFNVDADSTAWLGPFSSGRYWQAGTDDDAMGLWVDLDDDSNVTLTAFHLPVA